MSLSTLAPELRYQIFDLVIEPHDPTPALLAALRPSRLMYEEALSMVAEKNIFRAHTKENLHLHLDRLSPSGVSLIRRLSIRGGCFSVIPALLEHPFLLSLTSLTDLHVYFAAGSGPHTQGYFDQIVDLAKRFTLERLSITNRGLEISDEMSKAAAEIDNALGIEAAKGWYNVVPGKFPFELMEDPHINLSRRPHHTWAWFNERGGMLEWKENGNGG